MEKRKIAEVVVTHLPHVSIYTGIRHITTQHASIKVEVKLDDGALVLLATIPTPQRGVRKHAKVQAATLNLSPLIGLEWAEVKAVVGRLQFFPGGRPWGIRYSGTTRWFACFCGGSTKVDRPTWEEYKSDRSVNVRCDHCGITFTLARGDDVEESL